MGRAFAEYYFQRVAKTGQHAFGLAGGGRGGAARTRMGLGTAARIGLAGTVKSGKIVRGAHKLSLRGKEIYGGGSAMVLDAAGASPGHCSVRNGGRAAKPGAIFFLVGSIIPKTCRARAGHPRAESAFYAHEQAKRRACCRSRKLLRSRGRRWATET